MGSESYEMAPESHGMIVESHERVLHSRVSPAPLALGGIGHRTFVVGAQLAARRSDRVVTGDECGWRKTDVADATRRM